MAEVLSVPVAMAERLCVTGGQRDDGSAVFTRAAIDELDVNRLRRLITSEGQRYDCDSSMLTPNTYLLLGQNERSTRFKAEMHKFLPDPAHVKINPEKWPPFHTPIVRQINTRSRGRNDGCNAGWTAAALPARVFARNGRSQLR